jgi:hypothetical protein
MTTALTATENKPLVALYDQNERLTGIVQGWRAADSVLTSDPDIRRAVATSELSIEELLELDRKIAEMRYLRGTL